MIIFTFFDKSFLYFFLYYFSYKQSFFLYFYFSRIFFFTFHGNNYPYNKFTFSISFLVESIVTINFVYSFISFFFIIFTKNYKIPKNIINLSLALPCSFLFQIFIPLRCLILFFLPTLYSTLLSYSFCCLLILLNLYSTSLSYSFLPVQPIIQLRCYILFAAYQFYLNSNLSAPRDV